MIDPGQNKKQTWLTLKRLAHQNRHNQQALLDQLKSIYTAVGQAISYPDYSGPEQRSLDSPIQEAEVGEALLKLRNSTPGEDQITNVMLRNIDDRSISLLTDYSNEC